MSVNQSHYLQMVEDIEENYAKFDAFIIMHGTDTMAYTASALSFMLENLGKSVILTGSQVPFAQEPNDAAHNLLMSLTIAGHFEIPEVCIYFDHKLFRGNRSRKVSALGFDAFNSLNFPALVKVGTEVKVNWNVIRRPPPREESVVFHKSLSQNVGVLKLFPGVSTTTVKNFLLPPLEGCILETYGTGNAPSNRPDFLEALKEAIDRGVIIVNITQCHKGMVTHGTYATSSTLAAVGVLSGFDMTTEAALAKLSYLLAHKSELGFSHIKELVGTNLRGELTSDEPIKFSFQDESFLKSVAMALHAGTSNSRLDKPTAMPLVSLRTSTAALPITTNSTSTNSVTNSILTSPSPTSILPQSSKTILTSTNSSHEPAQTNPSATQTTATSANTRSPEPTSQLGSYGNIPSNSQDDLKNALFPVLLCAAAQMGSVDALRVLIDSGASANCIYDGRTPLHIAAREGHLRATQFLVERAGAKVDALDKWNYTPLDDALSLAHTAVAEYLKSVNACESASSTKISREIPESSNQEKLKRHPNHQ